MRNCFVILCIICFSTNLSGQGQPQQGQGTPQAQRPPQAVKVLGSSNVNHHGDPPYLLEEGWIPLINGKDMGGWKFQDESRGVWSAGRTDTWTSAKSIYWDQATDPRLLKAAGGPGDRIVNIPGGPEGTASNLISMETAGDMELYAEFMIPEGANSGVYMHGLYELQIRHTFGLEQYTVTEYTGALYYYENRRTHGISGAIAPLVRAERPNGQWNAYHIWFQAPKFDASGKKIENAKFLRVLLNGVLIHENQERIEGTQACLDIPEAAKNPVVMLQGDHGSVAFRNIYYKPLNK